MKIFIAQINPTVGALRQNMELILDAYRRGVDAGADVVATTELAVTGYPPKDLLERPQFVSEALRVTDELVAATGSAALIFGCVARNEDAAAHLRRLRRGCATSSPLRRCSGDAGRRRAVSASASARTSGTTRDFWSAAALRFDPIEERARAGRDAARQHLGLALRAGKQAPRELMRGARWRTHRCPWCT
jgi:hypothetical protein